MDEPILQLLNHLTLRHFIWGAIAATIALGVITLIWIAAVRRLMRWARRA